MGLHKLSRKLPFYVQWINVFLDIKLFPSIHMEAMIKLDVQTIVVQFKAIFD